MEEERDERNEKRKERGRQRKKGTKGDGRVMWMRERESGGRRRAADERREDVAAGYQQRTTKVIKLGWMAGTDRLVGHSIGNSTNLWTS